MDGNVRFEPESTGTEAVAEPDVRVELISTLCGAGSCPTVYRTNRGTLVVQGRTLDAGSVGIALSSGETLVEIPAGLLALAPDPQAE
jgi:hypothetical protein